MTTQLELPPQGERYAGLHYDQWMQDLADALAVEIAEHIRAKRHDFQHADRSLLPFYAYEINAVNYTQELGEVFERSSLEFAARLNELAGTPESWLLLCRSLGSGADLRYTTGMNPVRNTGVELDIIPPSSISANVGLLAHLARVARVLCVPYTLEVVSINILSRILTDVYVYAAGRPYVYRLIRGEGT